jgi:hypothetical protein
MPLPETLGSSLQVRLSSRRIARASALAPLLLVVPLLVFTIALAGLAPPRLPVGFGFLLIAVGVLPIYLVLVAAYLALTFVLRAFQRLSLRSLLLASAAASVSLGGLFLHFAFEKQASPFEEVEAFAIGAGFYLPLMFGMSWLWWRIARGPSASRSASPAHPSEA